MPLQLPAATETLIEKPVTSIASVRVALLSDLHCRLAGGQQDSFLEVGAMRVPSGRHPVQALIELIRKEGMRADALLSPGDLADKVCQEGLSQSWDFALELGAELGAKDIIPVLGNHDVDSRRLQPKREPFYFVRNMRPGFPFQDPAAVRSFFSDGFCVLNVGEFTQVIAINTVIDHTNEETAKRGSFDISRIDRLRETLHNLPSAPIRIALMHHHPTLHTGPFSADTDVIETGDLLLEALRQNDCRFVVHGHKHLARLLVHNGVAILACGSFSANLGVYASSMANMFHTANIEYTPTGVRGQVRTWVFHYGTGWGQANIEHSGFPFLTGFGARQTIDEIESGIVSLADSNVSESRFLPAQLLAVAPDLHYLAPSDFLMLRQRLREKGLHLSDTADGTAELWRTFSSV